MIAEQISADDLCLYAMGLLGSSESAQIAEFLSESTEARAELERIHGDLCLLAFTAEPVQPSSTVRQRVLRETARMAKTSPAMENDGPASAAARADVIKPDPHISAEIPTDTWEQDSYTPSVAPHVQPIADEPVQEAPAKRSVASTAVSWLGWALAAALGGAIWFFVQQNQSLRRNAASSDAKAVRTLEELRREATNTADAVAMWDLLHSGSARHVLLRGQVAGNTASVLISVLPGRGTLVLQAVSLQPLAAGKSYELWRIPQGGTVPVPLGSIQPDAQGFAVLALPSMLRSDVPGSFGVTVESEGGSSSPTLPLLLAEAQ